MGKEEAIKILENGAWWDMVGTMPCDSETSVKLHAALDAAIAALRAQQAPVKLERSRWEECTNCWRWDRYDFCPVCGRPITEEAWAELERRINDGTID